VHDLTRLLAELPSPPVLIGHSMGTAVIQKYLEGGHAKAAILLAPVPSHGGWQVGARMIHTHGPGILRDVFSRNILYPTAQQFRAQCFSDAAPDALIEQVLTQVHMESIPALADLLLFDLPRPKRIRGQCPMLVIGGDADALFSVDEMHKAARELGADVQIFPGIAHNLMQDVGWRGVAECMMDWMRSLPN
jgi:pimeloyl-ACP methyl ester carboxylesterase